MGRTKTDLMKLV